MILLSINFKYYVQIFYRYNLKQILKVTFFLYFQMAKHDPKKSSKGVDKKTDKTGQRSSSQSSGHSTGQKNAPGNYPNKVWIPDMAEKENGFFLTKEI